MRYLAQRCLDITLPGQSTTSYQPGEVLTDFLCWPERAQSTLLRTGHVRLDTRAVLDDGSCATCGQPSPADTPRKKNRAS